MPIILIWFLAYVVPAITAWAITYFLTHKKGVDKYNLLIIHALLITSICMSQYVIHALGLSFPWGLNLTSFVALILAMVFAVGAIGASGAWYIISALIQELTMLSIALILLPVFPVYIVVLLIAPTFVVVHFQSQERWQVRLFLLSVWGIGTILLFILGNVLVKGSSYPQVGS
jgi:hypothetical protein